MSDTIVVFYFSGTGNTRFIAESFSRKVEADCHSIEEEIDFKELITDADVITFCYPVYGSCVPFIMREFVKEYKSYLNNKNIIIFCTQNLFSGDGARVFTDMLRDIEHHVIYAEHFNMPNNICNLFFYPLSSEEKIKKYIFKADMRINKVCLDISNGIIKKRGFNAFSKYLGLFTQRFYFYKVEQIVRNDVRINSDCISCLLCIKICPMKNLEYEGDKVVQKGKCTLCYRCVNRCPEKAITVLRHERVKKQYSGIEKIGKIL